MTYFTISVMSVDVLEVKFVRFYAYLLNDNMSHKKKIDNFTLKSTSTYTKCIRSSDDEHVK